VDDASGLCPSFIVTAGFDPLRDEGEAYACKLAQAGVRTLLRRYDGFVHGFLNMVGPSPASRDIVIEIATAFDAFVRDLQAAP
jgi:acetyl esterase